MEQAQSTDRHAEQNSKIENNNEEYSRMILENGPTGTTFRRFVMKVTNLMKNYVRPKFHTSEIRFRCTHESSSSTIIYPILMLDKFQGSILYDHGSTYCTGDKCAGHLHGRYVVRT